MATSTEFSKPLNQDISEKADKVSSATNGHFAGLDSNGNLTDSGKSATDFVGAPSFYATEMPMSSSDSTKVSQAIANKLQSFGYVANLDMTRQQVIALNPTDIGNIYGYICNTGYTSVIGFVHKTQEYGGQLRLTYTDGIKYRRYYNGTWAAWQELATNTVTDITSSCTWGSDISVKYCKVIPALKQMFLYAQIPSGKANTFGFCKLPSGYKFADSVIETISLSGSQRIQYGVSANADMAYLYTSDGNTSAVSSQVNAILFYT